MRSDSADPPIRGLTCVLNEANRNIGKSRSSATNGELHPKHSRIRMKKTGASDPAIHLHENGTAMRKPIGGIFKRPTGWRHRLGPMQRTNGTMRRYSEAETVDFLVVGVGAAG